MVYSFDIHGVLDDLPIVFVELNKALFNAGHEIHIVTGSHYTPELGKKLNNIGIRFHHFFSIADHCKQNGIAIRYDEKGDPWVDEDTWNKTKGEYCASIGSNLHFDDSDKYHEHFTTPYARVYTKNNKGGEKKLNLR